MINNQTDKLFQAGFTSAPLRGARAEGQSEGECLPSTREAPGSNLRITKRKNEK